MDGPPPQRWDRSKWITVFSSHSPTIREVTECLGLSPSKTASGTNRGIPKFDAPEFKSLASEVTRLSKELPQDRDALLDFAADSKSLERELNELMEQWGASIWGKDADRSRLLVADPDKRTYYKDLHYEDPEDREMLKTYLHRWIVIKACYYIRNKKLKKHSLGDEYETIADFEGGSPVTASKPVFSPAATPLNGSPPPPEDSYPVAGEIQNIRKRKSSVFTSTSDGEGDPSAPGSPARKRSYNSASFASARKSPRKSLSVGRLSENAPPSSTPPSLHTSNTAPPPDTGRPLLSPLSSNAINGVSRPASTTAGGFAPITASADSNHVNPAPRGFAPVNGPEKPPTSSSPKTFAPVNGTSGPLNGHSTSFAPVNPQPAPASHHPPSNAFAPVNGPSQSRPPHGPLQHGHRHGSPQNAHHHGPSPGAHHHGHSQTGPQHITSQNGPQHGLHQNGPQRVPSQGSPRIATLQSAPPNGQLQNASHSGPPHGAPQNGSVQNGPIHNGPPQTAPTQNGHSHQPPAPSPAGGFTAVNAPGTSNVPIAPNPRPYASPYIGGQALPQHAHEGHHAPNGQHERGPQHQPKREPSPEKKPSVHAAAEHPGPRVHGPHGAHNGHTPPMDPNAPNVPQTFHSHSVPGPQPAHGLPPKYHTHQSPNGAGIPTPPVLPSNAPTSGAPVRPVVANGHHALGDNRAAAQRAPSPADTALLQCELLGLLMRYFFQRDSKLNDDVLLQNLEYIWMRNEPAFRRQMGHLYDIQAKVLFTWMEERRKITQLQHSMEGQPGVRAAEMVDRLLAMNDLRIMRLKWKALKTQDRDQALSPEDLLCRNFAAMTKTEGTEHLFKDGLERLNDSVFEFLRTEDMKISMSKR